MLLLLNYCALTKQTKKISNFSGFVKYLTKANQLVTALTNY